MRRTPILLLVLLLAMLAVAAVSPVFPIRNGRLQTPLDGGGQAITNVLNVLTPDGKAVGALGGLTNGTYYVSAAEGNDETGDGTVNNPWLTPTNAIARVTGGLIVVDSGQYQYEIIGKDGVSWQLASDCIIGSTNIIDGPVFTATNGVSFTITGPGSILATASSVTTSGTGAIRIVGGIIIPAVVFTNTVTGYWTEP